MEVIGDISKNPYVKSTELTYVSSDFLSCLARPVNPDRLPSPHCQRCTELQRGPAFRGVGEIWPWGQPRDLKVSASGGCPVCSLLFNAVKYPGLALRTDEQIESELKTDFDGKKWMAERGIRRKKFLRTAIKIQIFVGSFGHPRGYFTHEATFCYYTQVVCLLV